MIILNVKSHASFYEQDFYKQYRADFGKIVKQRLSNTLLKKCPYSELFWPEFFRIWTEYGEIRSISPYSVWMRKNEDQKNSEYGHFLRCDTLSLKFCYLKIILHLSLLGLFPANEKKNLKGKF